MKFMQLKYFLAVAQTGSITKAAEKLFITQSALSRVIQRLESELEVSLFDREPGRIVLNENGRILQKSVGRMFDELDAGLRAIAMSEKPGQPVVKIRSDIVDDILTSMSDICQSRFPDVSFRFQEHFGDEDADIRSGDAADILLTCDYDANMVIAATYRESWCIITSRSVPSGGDLLTREEFLTLPLAFYGPKSDLRFIRSTFERSGVSPNILLFENNRQAASLINKGLARGCVPFSLCCGYEPTMGQRAPFNFKSVEGVTLEREIYLCRSRSFPGSDREAEVFRFVKEHTDKFMSDVAKMEGRHLVK